MINTFHSILLIAVASIVTFALRAIPFVLFGGKRKMPSFVQKVADLLPPAIMAVLVIYCIKDSLAAMGTDTISAGGAIFSVVVLHVWKRNTLLSIFVGTGIYMLGIRLLPVLL